MNIGPGKRKFGNVDSDKKFDFNWLLTHPHLSLATKVHGFSSGTFARCIGRFVFGAARTLLHSYKCNKVAEGSIAFFTSSNNQLQALYPVAKHLENACIVEVVDPSNKRADVFFPLHRAYFRSISDFIALGWNYRKYNALHKLVIKSRGDLLALAPSLESVAINFLQTSKPAMVVVSNDTVLWCRAILSAARSLEIPTVYLQHAPVSDIVPPLNVNFAFLDGLDAAIKYQNAGIDTQCWVYLSGGPRQDQFGRLFSESQKGPDKTESNSIVQIGICTNMVDDMHNVTNLLKQVVQLSPPNTVGNSRTVY